MKRIGRLTLYCALFGAGLWLLEIPMGLPWWQYTVGGALLGFAGQCTP
jgi:hypothetical protein